MNTLLYVEQLRTLNVNRYGDGRYSPHKPCMLLALLELIEAGILIENRVEFNDTLIRRYKRYFDVVKEGSDTLNPWLPFYHLSNDSHEGDHFWFHRPIAGREQVLQAMSTAGSRADITDNIDCVMLADDLYDLLQDAENRDALRETLLLKWFPDKREALDEQIGRILHENRYETRLRDLVVADSNLKDSAREIAARSAAFRQVVLEAYDYRCAATGVRILLPDSTAMVEAAHIIPFKESHNDLPTNGIALCPNMHWAMDRHVIAPGPDLRWHVAKYLDRRFTEYEPLLELDGQEIITPKLARFHPSEESLQWRYERMRQREARR